MCELAKLHFLSFRNEYHVSSDFDSYLKSIPVEHKSAIMKICHNLSKSSDFYSLNYHIYQLLEYKWLSHNWSEWIHLCDELLTILPPTNLISDSTISKIIQTQAEDIKKYKEFFEYLFTYNNQNITRHFIVHRIDDNYLFRDHKELESEQKWYLNHIKRNNASKEYHYIYEFSIHFKPYK